MASLNQSKKIVEISQAANPKIAILNAAGDLTGVEVFWDLVLVGTFFRPEKTLGGIIRPPDNIREDEFQSKVGLVLKKGPNANGGPEITEGDWVIYSVGDAPSVRMGEAPCRWVPYDRIRGKTDDPMKVF